MPGGDTKKQRRIRLIILGCLVLVFFLFLMETRVSRIGTVHFPISGNVLVFILININVLLLLLMVFLSLRSLVQLVFERRQRLLGARLRTKLVISFVSLSLVPTGLLFFIALQFVSTSMDYWFNINVEQSLQASLNIAKEIYQEAKVQVIRQGHSIAGRLAFQEDRPGGRMPSEFQLAEHLDSSGLNGLAILSEQRTIVAEVLDPLLEGRKLPEIPPDLLRRSLAGETGLVAVQAIEAGELVCGLTPVSLGAAGLKRPGLLVTFLLIPRSRLQRMEVISNGLEGYRQLMLLKTPIKTSLLVMLLIVTLLIIFSAIWFGFYVARGITGPIGALAAATQRVAEGELDFVIPKDSSDEMGMLVDSFNRMTRDLLVSKQQVEKASQALREGNQELEERRRYTEIILQNVTAGVISLDQDGRITTINRFAENILRISKDKVLGKDYHSILRPDHMTILENFLAELSRSGKSFIERPLRLTVNDETFSLRINFSRLEDEEGGSLGVVLVFDNLTELEKAQRMAAWREVARRIAHEVKNPLTPIQLSAQRLRKKYLERLAGDQEVFDLCTRTIINQVDELKRLVGEFSSFARMPAVRKDMNSLPDMVREVIFLYREAHKSISFSLSGEDDIPVFLFDFKQMKRVLINLFDNAVAVLPHGGVIKVKLSYDRQQSIVLMEVMDNGPGVKDQDKLRLFEPYFSTKKSGTGLGLAIASTIIADHGGYIRVRENEPSGARFIVELPVAADRV